MPTFKTKLLGLRQNIIFLRLPNVVLKYFLFTILVITPFVWANNDRLIYHISIVGTIDQGLLPYVKRVIEESEKGNALAVLIEINTFGGRLDAMTEIRDAILNTNIRVIGYVNKRAISAGALIALACPELYMAPGATIGAATPVDQKGTKASEKIVSYARAEFKATAERNNRPVDIAMAMVDEEVNIEGLVEKGKLLTLTAKEAVKYKVADEIHSTLDDLLSSLDLKSATINWTKTNWAENVIRILNHPVFSGLLLTVGLLGLITEVVTAGWGIPGTLGLIALILYFGSHFMVGLAGVYELLLIMAGLGLILLEVFVIPGFGFAGGFGILCLIGGMILSMLGKFPTSADISRAIWVTIGSLVLAIAGMIVLIKLLEKHPFWAKVSLASIEQKDLGFVSSAVTPQLIGAIGIAVTDLRPAGIGFFNDERIDVTTSGDYIEAGEKIKIVKDEGYRRIVEKVRE